MRAMTVAFDYVAVCFITLSAVLFVFLLSPILLAAVIYESTKKP